MKHSHKKPTRAQKEALAFLDNNGGLEVPNMNMHGRSKEWPTRATLQAIIDRGWAKFEQLEFSWKVTTTDAGKTLIA